jgi:ribosomal protein L9
MDLRVYYAKMREAAATITGESAIVMSLETPDGGKAGVCMEASKGIAARLLVDGRARLATAEEIAAYNSLQEELRSKAEQDLAPARLQVAVLSEKDLESFKSVRRTDKPKDK